MNAQMLFPWPSTWGRVGGRRLSEWVRFTRLRFRAASLARPVPTDTGQDARARTSRVLAERTGGLSATEHTQGSHVTALCVNSGGCNKVSIIWELEPSREFAGKASFLRPLTT